MNNSGTRNSRIILLTSVSNYSNTDPPINSLIIMN